MAASEPQVTAVLDALRSVNHLLIAKAAELRRKPAWSEITSDLTFLGAATQDASVPSAVEIWGYVDAELEPTGGVAWHLNVRREGEGWEALRDMTLNPNDHPERSQRVVATLPPIRFASSTELAAGLPDAARELLALALPNGDPDTPPRAS